MRFINIWTARGLLGGPPRSHASRPYDTAAEALEGLAVEPDAGWTLLGTLDLRHPGGPEMVGEKVLVALSRQSPDQGWSVVEIPTSAAGLGGLYEHGLREVLIDDLDRDAAEAEYLQWSECSGTPSRGRAVALLDPQGAVVFATSGPIEPATRDPRGDDLPTEVSDVRA